MPLLRQLWMGLRIIHAALVVSIVLYGVVVVMVTAEPAPPGFEPNTNPALFAGVLGGVALMILVMIRVLRTRLMPKQSIEDDGRRTELDTPAPAGFVAAFSKLRSASIITWAMCESIAIFGLVLAFLTRDPLYFAPFAAVGAGALLYYAPTRKLLESVLRANR